MRHILLSLILSLGLTGAARSDEAAMQSVISDQIEAFLAEDTTRAFDFASPFIQRKFGTPETFGDMVRQGYPMVWQPSDVTFLDLEVIDGTPSRACGCAGRAASPGSSITRWSRSTARGASTACGSARRPVSAPDMAAVHRHGGLTHG